jgi:BTB/POZ domain-containing protein KCTD9
MKNHPPTKAELRESFKNIRDTPDGLQEEYDIAREAERLNIPVDEYRRYYELRRERSFIQHLPPKGWNPIEWGKYIAWRLIFQQPTLLWKSILKNKAIIGSTLTAVPLIIGVGRYVWDAPQREKQAHYQAWQIINSAKTLEGSSAGRIDALQDLVKDDVSLERIDIRNAQLGSIKLPNANLSEAKLNKANLNNANLSEAKLNNANLNNANLSEAKLNNAKLNNAKLVYADLSGVKLHGAEIGSADLSEAKLNNAHLNGANLNGANLNHASLIGSELIFTNLMDADLSSADLNGANLTSADLSGANLVEAKNINIEQVKKANNWQKACYDPEWRQKLELPKNPGCEKNEKLDLSDFSR